VADADAERKSAAPEPGQDARGKLSWRARLARVVLALLCALGLAATLLPVGRAASRAALLLPALITAQEPAPLVLAGDPIRHQQLQVISENGPVFLDVYEPTVPPPPAPGQREGVVIIPGVGDNRNVDQLVNLSRSLARAGLVVMDMTTPTLIQYVLSPQDGAAVVAAVDTLARWPGVGPTRVGILGFSAGGALACLAAVDPRLHTHLAYITLFGGYYDAGTLLRDVGRRALEENGTLHPWNPDPVPIQVLANTIATTLPSDEGQTLVNAFLVGAPPLSPGQLATLSPPAQAAYHLLAGDQPRQVQANLAALSPEMQALLTALSPSSVVSRLHTPIYLLHDRSDRFVPFTESRDFAAALARLGKPYQFVEFSIFQHTEVRTGLSLGPLLTDGSNIFRLLTALLLPAS
jgi:dienelactone hydrolase